MQIYGRIITKYVCPSCQALYPGHTCKSLVEVQESLELLLEQLVKLVDIYSRLIVNWKVVLASQF